MPSSSFYRSILVATLVAGTVSCDAILGLDPKPLATPDAGHGDAGKDAAEAGKGEAGEAGVLAMGAVGVSASYVALNWCVLVEDGSVWCWGDNEAQQLGEGTSNLWSQTPVQMKKLPAVAQVAVGNFTICALTRSGGVLCWGYGSDGELGNGSTTNTTAVPVEVKGLESGVASIAAGDGNNCAIKTDGSAWCWGLGAYGQIGNGSDQNALVPVGVTGLTSGVTSISVGGDTTCAVQCGGVLCWGSPSGFGELGNGTTDSSLVPVRVPSLSTGVEAVAVGFSSECALTSAGGVQCWGFGSFGELGDDNVANADVPIQVVGLTNGVTQIAAGSNFACAIKEGGDVVCWGENDQAQLGSDQVRLTNGDVYFSATPVAVKGISDRPAAITAGNAPCVVTEKGGVECWGATAELALSPVTASTEPKLNGLSESVTVGGYLATEALACDLTFMGAVQCWGGNDLGQLAKVPGPGSNVPVSVTLPTVATMVATGPAANFACAVVTGSVFCWGDNSAGQLGTNSVKSSANALAIPGIDTAVSVAVGNATACALTSSGGVMCWGDNGYGEFGNGSTTSSATPVQVTGLTSGVTAITVGVDDACALLSDGTIDCWGNNNNGELGNGTDNITKVPVPVSGITGALAVSLGWYSGCAVTSSGGVDCWGDNELGELGNGTMNQSYVPVPVSGILSSATAVSVGQGSACAIVAGGAQCWGNVAIGNGLSGPSYTSTPVDGLAAGVTSVSVGSGSACAVAAGSVLCWGSNSSGELGTGDPIDDLLATPLAGFP
jgi:alpha-tubulin suppressor-like RCC1 family protein